jgi:hypothetical protein
MFPTDSNTAAGAQTASAAYTTGNARHGLEADIKVALAGMAAQDRAYPKSVKKEHVINDLLNVRSWTIKIAFIMAGVTVPTEAGWSL